MVPVRGREQIERQLSIVARAQVRRWRDFQLLHPSGDLARRTALAEEEQALTAAAGAGATVDDTDDESSRHWLRFALEGCGSHQGCAACVAAREGMEVGCAWCKRRHRCFPDMQGLTRSSESRVASHGSCGGD